MVVPSLWVDLLVQADHVQAEHGHDLRSRGGCEGWYIEVCSVGAKDGILRCVVLVRRMVY
jgi:hypothetical protein